MTTEDEGKQQPAAGNSSAAHCSGAGRERSALPALPLPGIATYRREDIELPLVTTACVSLADCP